MEGAAKLMALLPFFGLRDIIAGSPLAGSDMSLAATLVKVTWAARDPADPTAGRDPTETDYPCRVIPARKKTVHREGSGPSNRKDQEAVFKVIGGTLPSTVQPAHGDYLEVEGVKWRIVGDTGGGDIGAVFPCTCRVV